MAQYTERNGGDLEGKGSGPWIRLSQRLTWQNHSRAMDGTSNQWSPDETENFKPAELEKRKRFRLEIGGLRTKNKEDSSFLMGRKVKVGVRAGEGEDGGAKISVTEHTAGLVYLARKKRGKEETK